MRNDGLAWLINSTVHAHDQLMLETNICIQKEVVELILEVFEQALTDLILNARRQLIIKTKFFDDQIEIIHKGILNKFFD